MRKKNNDMNTKNFFNQDEELNRKIDISTDAFTTRIEAIRQGDLEKAEFIEKMIVEPVDKQISFLAERLVKQLKG